MAGDFSASSVEGDLGPISAINVTPFVDVVLVLLVIFMVTAPALMKDGFGIHLPKASSSEQNVVSNLGVAITRQGQFLVNGQLSSPDGLVLEVKKILTAQPNAHALISADADARHADVIKAIDLIKSAGISHFALQIEKPE